MGDLQGALRRLAAANEKVAQLDAKRDAAMRERDEALRAAATDGATYEAIKKATGLSNATVSKALRRK